MSYRKERYLSLATLQHGHYLADMKEQDVHSLFLELLYNGVHGFCFSLYEEGQRPGDAVTMEQVRRRMEILRPHTRWIRTFSCTDGNELIPVAAKELGLKTLVGAWLGDDPEINEREVEGLLNWPTTV
ncbi:MAG: hypothetical protein R2795_17940 [Saprospiraceae bacterium]